MDTKALRQKILDLAIHGKVVPQDPNDESHRCCSNASVARRKDLSEGKNKFLGN